MSEMKEFRGMDCKIGIGNNGNYVEGYVVHVDKEIGITIYDKKTDKPVYCLNRKELLNYEKERDAFGMLELYNKVFDEALELIKKKEPTRDITFEIPGYGEECRLYEGECKSFVLVSCPYKK